MASIPVEPTEHEMPSDNVVIEREVTKRRLIESATNVVLVVLYMIFTLVRDRDPGVVALDPDDSWKD